VERDTNDSSWLSTFLGDLLLILIRISVANWQPAYKVELKMPQGVAGDGGRVPAKAMNIA